ncbi:MAG: metal ABC transporter permease [Acidimicrobiales bacterium]
MISSLVGEPRLSWNLIQDVRHLFDYPFMVNAFRAGTVVAVTASLVGWFMVLRRQSFAGHTLAVIGLPGGAGAALIGLSAQLGFFTFCIAGAVVIALGARAGRSGFSEESAVVGTVQAFAIACGFLFVALYRGNLNGVNTLLFGSLIGITHDEAWTVLVVGLGTISALVLIARPLLFASIDAEVASARGVPVRSVSVLFTVLLGITAAASIQITGALLAFALLVVPPATAQLLSPRPVVSALIAIALALGVTWAGLAFAYYSTYPIGFWITTFAFVLFVSARVGVTMGSRLRWRS